MQNKGKNTILVFTAKLAKQLLKEDYTIVDIKPNRDNRDRTVFVFLDEYGLRAKIRELTYKSE